MVNMSELRESVWRLCFKVVITDGAHILRAAQGADIGFDMGFVAFLCAYECGCACDLSLSLQQADNAPSITWQQCLLIWWCMLGERIAFKGQR